MDSGTAEMRSDGSPTEAAAAGYSLQLDIADTGTCQHIVYGFNNKNLSTAFCGDCQFSFVAVVSICS